MPVYIALLRGINVSGQKKVSMAGLRDVLTGAGFQEVRTYIQSGNVIFSDTPAGKLQLQHQIGELINKHFGFEVAVLVLSMAELREIIDENPFRELHEGAQAHMYFTFLFSKPADTRSKNLQQESFANEECALSERCVYMLCHKGMGKARLNNNLIETRLQVKATTRNFRTTLKLLEMGKAMANGS